MNDLGSLATDIVDYSFPDDTGKFPVSFVSGWLETHIGTLNGLTHEEFNIDSTGGIGPSGLYPVEEDIFKTLYEINYYNRAAREALRGVIWDTDNITDIITMVREGDSTIQKTSSNSLSKTFATFAKDLNEDLDQMVFQYNFQKSSPLQVAGEDGSYVTTSFTPR